MHFTHTAWKGTVAPSSLYAISLCSLQGTTDTGVTLLSLTPPAFTPLACLATAFQPIGPKDRDFFRPAFWGPGWHPIWQHRTKRYVSPARRGMEWVPTAAPSSLYATSPCSLQGTTDTGVILLSLTPPAFTPLACLATALQHTGPENRTSSFFLPPSRDKDDISARGICRFTVFSRMIDRPQSPHHHRPLHSISSSSTRPTTAATATPMRRALLAH